MRARDGPESLYQRNRHSLDMSRASVASRPMTDTRSSSPSAVVAETSTSPQPWVGRGATSATAKPSPARASVTCAGSGTPAGEPNANRTRAATPHASDRLPTTPAGRPDVTA